MSPPPLRHLPVRPGAAGDDGLREAYEEARLTAQRAHADSARLVRMLSVIGAPLAPADLVESALEALSDLFDADLVLAVRTGAAGTVVDQALGFGDDEVPGLPLLPGPRPFTGAERVTAWALPDGVPAPVLAGTPVRSAAWLPLHPGAGWGPAIVMLRSDATAFHQGELEVLASVASRLRLSLEAGERRGALARVTLAGQRLGRHLQVDELLAETAAVLVEVTGAAGAAVVRVVDGRALLAAGSSGPQGPGAGPGPSWGGPAEALAVWPEVSRGRGVVVEVADGPPEGADGAAAGSAAPVLAPPLVGGGSLVCVPVMGDDGPVALLWVRHEGGAAAAAATAEAVGVLAGYLAPALVNTGLYRALADSEERLRMLTDSINDLVVVLAAEGTVSWASPSHARQIGVPPEAIVGQDLFEQAHPDDRLALEEAFTATTGGGPGTTTAPHLEVRLLTADGTWAWVECSLSRAPGGSGDVVISARLIGDRRRLQDELERRATHDPLTGLANRELVRETLAAELAATGPGGVGVLFVDLDRFKQVNDRLGHEGGDELLRQVAERLRACVRPGDLLARLGGDEFVVVLPAATGLDVVAEVGERALAAVSAPFLLGGETARVGASIGGVLGARGDGEDLAAGLLRDADAAMYQAKAAGRGRVEVLDGRGARRALDALRLRADVGLALERGQLELSYQPVVDLEGGATRGFEALARWHHPTRGAVAPGELAALAEDCGAAAAIGDWTLAGACRQLAAWRRLPGRADLTVAVAVAPARLDDPSFAARTLAAVRACGLPPASVRLEVAEGPEVTGTAVEQVGVLRGAGVGVAVDGFGTSRSGLGHLRDLPADALTVDRTLVAGLTAAGRDRAGVDRAVVRTVLALAEAVGLEVVAEGVETEEQRRVLVGMGCSLGRGGLFAAAAPAEEVTARLLAGDAAGTPPGPRPAPR